MRISSWRKLYLVATVAALGVLVGRAAAQTSGPATAPGVTSKSVRDSHKTFDSLPPDEQEAIAEKVYRQIVSACVTAFPDDTKRQADCERTTFYNLCPKAEGARWSRKGCAMVGKKLRDAGNNSVPAWACAGPSGGDQLCLISPTVLSEGDLLSISIDLADGSASFEDAVLTVEVTTSVAPALSPPYRDPESAGDLTLTWTAGTNGWIGTASLASFAGAGSTSSLFAIDNFPSGASVSIATRVDYVGGGSPQTIDVSLIAQPLSTTTTTP